jgi:hypothetical protein
MFQESWQPLMPVLRQKYIVYFVDIEVEHKTYANWDKYNNVTSVPAYAVVNKGATKLIDYEEGFKNKDDLLSWLNTSVVEWNNRRQQAPPYQQPPPPTPPLPPWSGDGG